MFNRCACVQIDIEWPDGTKKFLIERFKKKVLVEIDGGVVTVVVDGEIKRQVHPLGTKFVATLYPQDKYIVH